MSRPKYKVPNMVKVANEVNLYQPYNVMANKPKYLVYDIENYMNGLFFGVFQLLDANLNEVLSPFLFTETHVQNIIDFVYETEITIVGFNNHHYDDKMLANIYFGRNPNQASHEIINVPFSKASEFDLMCNSLDVFKDVQGSLKYYEAVMGMNIMESGVPFDIERHLTQEEFENEVLYCLTDVRATVHAFRFRMAGGPTSIQNKLTLLNNYNMPMLDTRKTDNQLVQEILQGVPQSWETGYDELFDLDTFEDLIEKHIFNIPDVILDLYRDYHADYHEKVRTVENKREFKKQYTKKNNTNIFDFDTNKFIDKKDPIFKDKLRRVFLNFGWGGIHTFNFFEILTGNVLHADKGSYYPSIQVVFLMHLVNTKNPGIYKELLDGRISNKRFMDEIKSVLTDEEKEELERFRNGELLITECGDNVRALVEIEGQITGIKLILNKVYGLMGLATSSIFHPVKLTTVCVVGHLLITELIFRVFKYIPETELGQANTDGVIFVVEDEDVKLFEDICAFYADEIGISIDVHHFDKMIQSTVNNYILMNKGEIEELKGATTKNYKGSDHVEQAGRITNNLSIKSKALVDYFVYGTSVEDTVMNETDIGRFQYIASVNGKVAGFYNKTQSKWEMKNNRIMVMKDSQDEIVKITKSNINDFIEKFGMGDRLDENNFQLVDDFKEIYTDHIGEISELGLAQHTGVLVTNVLHETGPELLDKIDRQFYIEMCKSHIETFIQGKIEDEEEEE